MPRARQLADIVAILAIFFAALDQSTNAREAPLMLLSAASAALLAWCVVRFILRENLLAYPLTAALASLLGTAATLLQNHRGDLVLNGALEIVVAIALIIWMTFPSYEAQHA